MKMRRAFLVSVLILAGCVVAAVAQQHISAAEARDHIGQVATVCGKVASLHWATRSRGEPTFINLDEPYPQQIFTVLIWGSDRSKFGDVEGRFTGKTICATGAVSVYREVPEIIARSANQITVQR